MQWPLLLQGMGSGWEGFSSSGSQALRAQAQIVVVPRGRQLLGLRDLLGPGTSCIARKILNPWPTREARD